MSKKKSLGSSPIGLKSESDSMGFIPDYGVSTTKQERERSSPRKEVGVKERFENETEDSAKQEEEQDQPSKKKIVSYNLEMNLVDRIKSIAQAKDMYYSSFVSMVIKDWISENT